MGIFNFLKKDKEDTSAAGMELPPIPKIEGMGDDSPDSFPEMVHEDIPPLPDTSLPPLPSEIPGAVPPEPQEEMIAPPKMELPKLPAMGPAPSPKPKKMETKPLPQFPEFPEMPDMPEAPEMPEEPAPQEEMPSMDVDEEQAEEESHAHFPSIPDMPTDDVIPDKIPPLEGIPEAPDFTLEESRPKMMDIPPMEPMRTAPKPIRRPEMPPAYFPAQEPVMHRREIKGPLFIRTDRFKALLDDIEQIRSTFKQEDDIFFRVNDVKSAQDQKFEGFRQALEDIQRKLLFIDRSLFEVR